VFYSIQRFERLQTGFKESPVKIRRGPATVNAVKSAQSATGPKGWEGEQVQA